MTEYVIARTEKWCFDPLIRDDDPKRHTVLMIEDGILQWCERGSIFNQVDWPTWFRHGGEFSQPEGGDIWAHRYPERVLCGSKAEKLFWFWRIGEGGQLRQMAVEPGQRITFTAQVQGWSSNDDDGHTSTGVGEEAVAWPEGSQPENGEYLQDGRSNMTFYLGIGFGDDINPRTTGAVWGPGFHVYNGYAPLSVQAIVPAGVTKITLFTRAKIKWAYKHNDTYWDNLQCVIETPVGETEPDPPCRGKPRTEFVSRVNVVAAGMSLEDAVEVFSVGWMRGREMAGGSYDQAGAIDLDDRTAVLHGLPASRHQEFRDWYAQHYPGTKVEFSGDQDPAAPLVLRYPSTHMPPVITHPYNEDRGTYIHKGIDLRSSYAHWKDLALCALDGDVVISSNLGDGFGIQVQTQTVLPDGRVIQVRYAHLEDIERVPVGTHIHVGMVIGRPDNTGNSDGAHLHFDVKINGQYVDPEPLIAWPTAPPDPPPDPIPDPASPAGELWGLHIQNGYAGDTSDGKLREDFAYIRDAKPRVVKLVGNYQWAEDIKALSPETLVVARYHTNTQEPYWNCENGSEAGARAWMGKIYADLEKLAPFIDFYESVNEEIPTHNNWKLDKLVEFDCWLPEICHQEFGDDIAIAGLLGATGNPHETEVIRMVNAARQLAKYRGVIGYHDYFGYNLAADYCPLEHGTEAEFFSMRALWGWDPVFKAHGIKSRYIGTECGPIYVAGGPGHWHAPTAGGGWRWDKCMNGDFDLMLRLSMLERHVKAVWNTGNDNAYLGGGKFTLGGPTWGNFEYGPWLWRIRNAVRAAGLGP